MWHLDGLYMLVFWLIIYIPLKAFNEVRGPSFSFSAVKTPPIRARAWEFRRLPGIFLEMYFKMIYALIRKRLILELTNSILHKCNNDVIQLRWTTDFITIENCRFNLTIKHNCHFNKSHWHSDLTIKLNYC